MWQDESFDRIIRDEKEYSEKLKYIQNNPYKRWPELSEYDWLGFPTWEETGTEACPYCLALIWITASGDALLGKLFRSRSLTYYDTAKLAEYKIN